MNDLNNSLKTGSTKFQIEQLKSEIKNLQEHLKKNQTKNRLGNQKDIPAKRALLKKTARVKKLIKYQQKKSL